jgi:hypothetical protein
MTRRRLRKSFQSANSHTSSISPRRPELGILLLLLRGFLLLLISFLRVIMIIIKHVYAGYWDRCTIPRV